MTAHVPYLLHQSANQINQNVCGENQILSSQRLAESATAVLMNGGSSVRSSAYGAAALQQSASNNPQIVSSVLVDQGEYFFDDDFSVQFDACLREENNNNETCTTTSSTTSSRLLRGGGGSGGSQSNSLIHSRSDSCLYQLGAAAAAIVDVDMGEGGDGGGGREEEEEDLNSGIGDSRSSYELNQERSRASPTSMQMSSTSSIEQSSSSALLRHLLQRQVTTHSKDYKLAYMMDASALSSFRQDELTCASITTSSGAGDRTSAASNLSTWAALANHKLTARYQSQQDLSSFCSSAASSCWSPQPSQQPPKVITTTWGEVKKTSRSNSLLPSRSRAAAVTTWRQMKQAAEKGASWRQLKEAAKPPLDETRGRTPGDQHDRGRRSMRESRTVDVNTRSHSEPRDHQEMQRFFSGTLLELYQRGGGGLEEGGEEQPKQQQPDQLWASLGQNKQPALPPTARQLLGLSPSDETADGRPTFLTANGSGRGDPRHFGAQFPPSSFSSSTNAEASSQRMSRSAQRPSAPTPLSHGNSGAVRPRSASNSARRIAYPGLGTLSVPKPSRLEGTAFLSRTLPDLSFLASAPAPSSLLGTAAAAAKATDSGFASANSSANMNRRPRWVPICKRCGCSSLNSPQPGGEESNGGSSEVAGSPLTKHTSVPDLMSGGFEAFCHEERPLKSCLVQKRSSLDRTRSEPNVNNPAGIHNSESGDVTPIMELSSSQEDTTVADDDSGGALEFRAKKSVSFSERIYFHTLTGAGKGNSPFYNGDPAGVGGDENGGAGGRVSVISDLRVIPRDCGLYGQDPPLARFHLADSSPTAVSPSSEERKTPEADANLRCQALVTDVIKAVQDAAAYFLARRDLVAAGRVPNSTVLVGGEAAGGDGGDHLDPWSLVAPLRTLLTDGLLPPTQRIFTSNKAGRSRLWNLVEESCRPGVANRVLSEVFREIKILPAATPEKTKFKVFICVLLNTKALSMWVGSLVTNNDLLKRYFCPDAFLRLCSSSLAELYSHLSTSLELLLALPFRIDLNREASVGSANNNAPPVRGKHDISMSGGKKQQQATANQKAPRGTRAQLSSTPDLAASTASSSPSPQLQSLKGRAVSALASVKRRPITGGPPPQNESPPPPRPNSASALMSSRGTSRIPSPIRPTVGATSKKGAAPGGGGSSKASGLPRPR